MMLQTLNILRRIRDEPALRTSNKGICPIVQELMEKEGMQPSSFGSVQRMLKDTFKEWDKFSGDELYPVPSPRHKNSTPYNTYRKYYESNDMWQGPYGELRKELLEFTIEFIEKRIAAYLPLEEINAVLHKIQPGLVAKPHGFEYAITGVKTEGILPVQWRTGHIMYGYKNTPTPTGWFYASGIELETFVKGYK